MNGEGDDVATPRAQPDRESPSSLEDAFDLEKLTVPEVATDLARWQQGDLVRGVRLVWATSSGGDLLFDDADEITQGGGGNFEGTWLALPRDDGEEPDHWDFGIITSQTCDLGASGPGGRHPTFQVSPLIRLESLPDDRAGAVRRGATNDLVLVPVVPAPGEWAADLRISIPVSKGLLVGTERIHAFASELDSLRFADQVALKYRRPAVHDGVSDVLVPSLNALVKRRRSAGSTWPDRVEQFRLRVTSGTRLEPEAFELIVVTLDGKFSPAEEHDLREWRKNERKGLSKACNDATINPLRFLTLERVPVADYREAVLLAITELQRLPPGI